MTDQRSSPKQLTAALLGPEGTELSCEQCFELLDVYVEHEVSSPAADRLVPGMRQHLQGCPACAEEHDTLLELITTPH